MKILHINSYFSNRFFYQRLYEKQRQAGIEIKVIVPVAEGFQSQFLYDKDTVIDRCYSPRERFLYRKRFKKIINSIKKLINVCEFDVLHAYSLFTNGLIAYILAKQYHKPFIVTVRNGDVNVFFSYVFIFRNIGKMILMNADAVVFLSKSYQDKILNQYCKGLSVSKCSIIPNGIEDFWLRNLYGERRVGKTNGIMKALYVGEINKNKNLLTVARAIRRFNEGGNSLTYTVIGKVLDSGIKRQLESYEFVKIFSPMKKEELIQYYRSSDVYIMASFTESFGLTYVEAMTQGLPILYTENQGFDRQFPEGTVGYHVNPHSERDICDKLKLIQKQYELLSKNCQEKCKNFSWDKIHGQYHGLYAKLLGENK